MTNAPKLDRVVQPELPAAWPKDGFGPVAAILACLPDPSSLAPGARVGVSAGDDARRGLGRLLRAAPTAHLAVRCAALLAKGYVDVGAAEDAEGRALAIGRAP